MKFTPKSQKEIDEMKLLPEGEYPFQISGGEDTVSKAGNEMIKLLVRVFKADGNFVLVSDYLMEAMAYKLRHACEACGLLHEYESGVLLGTNFIGKTGHLKLKVKVDKEGKYADQNNIADYIVPKEGEAKKPLPVKQHDDLEDQIPF